MSSQNGENYLEDDIEVTDDELYTDKKIKQRILNTRELVSQSKNELETARLVEPDVEYTKYQGFVAWANLVQGYLNELGLLLNNDDIPRAAYYRDGIELGEVTLVPQDAQGVPFSKIVHDEVEAEDIIFQSPELERGCSLPEPETRTITGLRTLAQTDIVVEKHWLVVTNPRAPRPAQDPIETMDKKPLPKEIFQRALVASDEFLQNAGIGLDIKAKDYMGGEEPGL